MAAESYPTWVGGQDITADLLNSMLPKVVRKTADTSRTSTTTVSADPELQISLEANAIYVWEGWLKYTADPTADLVVDFTAPTGALGEWAGHGNGSSTAGATTVGYSIRTESNDIQQSRTYYGTTAADNQPSSVFLKGIVRMSSTAGTLTLDWGPANSVATATTVYTDSWLKFTRIA